MAIFDKCLLNLAEQAGQAIADIQKSGDFSTTLKDDNSPLTRADKWAHDIIMQGLKNYDPQGVIISEESYQGEKLPAEGWLVDPLDGTKEFLAGSPDFTVNIAYIKNYRPVFGVVYAPCHDRLYWGSDAGAHLRHQGKEQKLKTRKMDKDNVVACGSLRHDDSKAIKDFLHAADIGGIVDFIKMGSSLKFCIIAEAEADIYVRLTPTHAWDSAAGLSVLQAAGGYAYTISGTPYFYEENPLSGGFIASGSELPSLTLGR